MHTSNLTLPFVTSPLREKGRRGREGEKVRGGKWEGVERGRRGAKEVKAGGKRREN